jgi:hypothetical protein
VQIQVIDAGGRILKQETKQLAAGGNSFTHDISTLAKGVYFLNLKGDIIDKQIQFIKQ